MQRVAALLAAGLLLLPIAPLAAAPGKPAAKAAKLKRAAVPASEVVTAELEDDEAFGLRGQASFYGHGFQGRKTSTGERFDVRRFTAASNRFPLGTRVAVRRLDDGRCAIVKINDRMRDHRKRVIDVSRSAAEYLGMIRAGVVLVRVARLKAGAAEQGDAACQGAFEVDDPLADPCPACGRTPSLPAFDFGGD